MTVSLSYGFKAHFVAILSAPIGFFLRGYAIAVLWHWFAVPLGAPVIGWAHAYGIGALTLLAAAQLPAVQDKDIVQTNDGTRRKATTSERQIWVIVKVAMNVLPPLAALAFGYVAHRLM